MVVTKEVSYKPKSKRVYIHRNGRYRWLKADGLLAKAKRMKLTSAELNEIAWLLDVTIPMLVRQGVSEDDLNQLMEALRDAGRKLA